MHVLFYDHIHNFMILIRIYLKYCSDTKIISHRFIKCTVIYGARLKKWRKSIKSTEYPRCSYINGLILTVVMQVIDKG